ncbi:rCG42309 [Rattus norvegicus]|uniref:RCG42309 n=1 Tax=Rattus norvegicus TaxID=10116 RepID=A6KFU1_RAT|nr:rCG42309 [Rattus norvegicus]
MLNGSSCLANLWRTSSWDGSGVTRAPPIPERRLAYCCVYKPSGFAARRGNT